MTNMTTVAENLRTAFGRLQVQDLAGAERLCGEILRETPRHPDALHLLGVVRLAGGNAGDAVSLINQALEGRSRDAAMLENLGVAHLALRNFATAEALFRNVLALGASHGVLYMRLGIALSSQGKLADAEAALREAAARSPDVPDVHLNLGNTLAERGELDEALACYNRILALQPEHALARFNLGNLHRIAGRLAEAEISYKHVLAVAPNDADVHNNLSLVYEGWGRLDEAAACLRQALALNPDHVHALSNLGNVLRELGQHDAAAASCERALAIQPEFADALINLGNVRAAQWRPGDAQSLYERALRLNPRNVDAYRNLGKLFMDQGRVGEAITSYRRVLEFDRDQAHAYLELGAAHLHAGNLDAASACFRRALEIRPDHLETAFNLAETLKLQGKLDEAAEWYERVLAREPRHLHAMGGLIHAQQHMCRWNGVEERWRRLREGISAASDGRVSPFAMLSLPSTPAEQRACTEAWARRNVDPIAAVRPALGFDFSRRRARDRLRIGYLAWGLHRHATGYWAVELFELHDRARCEVFAYSYGPDDGSDVRARIRGACEHFVAMPGDSHIAAARRIYDDGVDVLVDLTGYSLGMRPQILALRPAPVQVNWFYAGTMGTRCMDYFIADPYTVPPELEPHFTERIARLPDCYMITDRKRPISDPGPSRADCGLAEGATVFCCFNQTYKILPDVFASWMRILRAVPGSVLWLLETNRWAVENLRCSALEQGVAAERIIFAPYQPVADHLARYRLADLALDTFPYTSHTTAADALWAGCPLVTRMGSTFASRVAGSALINAGMRELVADSAEACERLAIELAALPGRLQDIRRRLQASRDSCALFDTPRFVKNLEAAYENMFDAWIKNSSG
jgi:predicted O-linked N-acetylglucosamine transferase (SPINDLY family)